MVVDPHLVFRGAEDAVVIDKVHVGAVDIAVGGVPSQHGQVVGPGIFLPDPLHHAVVDFRDGFPVSGNFRGESGMGIIFLHSLEFVVNVFLGPVQVVEPFFDQLRIHGFDDAVLKFFRGRFNGIACGIHNAFGAFTHEKENAFALMEMIKVLGRILFRIGPGHGRTEPVDHHFPQHLYAGFHILDQIPVKPVVFRIEPEQLHRHFSDVAERALVADGNMPDIRTAGPPGNVLDPGDMAVGKHALQSHHHVFDSPVQGGELPDAPGGHQPAQLCHGFGLGGVTRGQALFPGSILQHLEGNACLCRGLHVIGIDFQNPVQMQRIDDHGVLLPVFQPPFRGRFTGPGDDVHPVPVAEGQNPADLLGGSGIHNGRGHGHIQDPPDLGVFLIPVCRGIIQVFTVCIHLGRRKQLV